MMRETMKSSGIRRWLVIAILSLIASSAVAQPVLKWKHQYDSLTGSSNDDAAGIGVDNNGNVYEGISTPGVSGGVDYLLLTYNSAGVLQHTTRVDDANANSLLTAMTVDQSTGDVYLTGVTDSGPYPAVLTVRIDATGTIIWAKFYSGQSGFATQPFAIAIDSQGNIVITGSEQDINKKESAFVLKYKASTGAALWAKHITTYYCAGNKVVVGPNDEVVVAGSARPTTNNDSMTAKFAADGTPKWVLFYDSPFHLDDAGVTVAEAPDGTVYSAGFSEVSATQSALLTLKISSAGVLQWAKRSDPVAANPGAIVIGMTADSADNCYVSGFVNSPATLSDGIVQKYRSDGFTEWSTQYDGPNSGNDAFVDVQLDSQGFPIVGGFQTSISNARDQVILKLNPSTGAIVWKQSLDDQQHEDDLAPFMTVTPEGDVFTEDSIDLPDHNVMFARYQQTPNAIADQYAGYEGNSITFAPAQGVLANDWYALGGSQFWLPIRRMGL